MQVPRPSAVMTMIATLSLVGVLSASAAFEGVITYVPITGDVDSGISADKTYTHALDFGTGAAGTVNGVAFTQSGVGGVAGCRVIGASEAHGGNNLTGVPDTDGIHAVLQDMIYRQPTADGPQTIVFDDLVPGREYDFRLYVRTWELAGARPHAIHFDIDNDGEVNDTIASINEDNPQQDPPGFANADQAYFISYRFTSRGALRVVLAPLTIAKWHIYGLTNEETGAADIPAASFAADHPFPIIANQPLTVQFTDLSGAGDDEEITGWAWDFGDGGASDEQHPAHTYTTPGVYDVTLTVTNSTGGQDTRVIADAVQVLIDNVAIIPLGADSADVDSQIGLGKVYSHLLDFGTGPQAQVNGVAFTKVDSAAAAEAVENFAFDIPNFHGGNNTTGVEAEQGMFALLTDMAYGVPGGATSASLALSNLIPGQTYDLRLYIRAWTPGAGRWITLGFDNGADGAFEEQFLFNADDARVLPAGRDGADEAYIISYTYVAGENGEMRVSLLPTNPSDSFHLYGLTNEQPSAGRFLTAGFSMTPRSPVYGAAPLEVQFEDISTSDGHALITEWHWDFGDGQTSAEQNPTHTYTTPGVFDVTLTVTDENSVQDSFTTARAVLVPSENLRYIPLNAETADSDSDIHPSKTYTHALDFGTGAGAVINGVAFTRVTNSAAAEAVPDFLLEFDTFHGGDANTGVNPAQGIHQLLSDMVYANPRGFTLSGLTPGDTYNVRVYTRRWSAGGSRVGHVSFDLGADGVLEEMTILSQDNASIDPPGFAAAHQAYMISWQYTADDSGVLRVNITSPNSADSWHLYGVSNEVVTPHQLNFESAVSSGLESVTSPVVRVRLTTAADEDVTFTYATRDGRATAPTDYEAVAEGQGTIPAGALTADIPIVIVDNDYPEANKGFFIDLLQVSDGVTLGHSTAHEYTIVDDDEREGPMVENPSFETPLRADVAWPGYTAIDGWTAETVSNVGVQGNPHADNPFANALSPLGNQVGFIQINAGAANALSQVISGFEAGQKYDVLVQANGRGGNSPILGLELGEQALIADLNVPAGIYRTVIGQYVADSDEDQELRIVNRPQGGDHTLLVDNVRIYKALAEVQFQLAVSQGIEGAQAELVVELSVPAPAGGVLVDFVTVDGTATAPDDYTATSGTLFFPEGEVMQTIQIETSEDDILTGTRSFYIQLGHRSGDFAMGDNWRHTYTIIDDDVELGDGLIGHWPFNETEGDVAADVSDSAVQYDATLTTGTVFAPDQGIDAGALLISGPMQNAQTELITSSEDGTTSLTNRISISGWARGVPNHYAALMMSRDQNTGAPNAGLYAERAGGTGEVGYMWNEQFHGTPTGLRWPGPDEWVFMALSVSPDQATVYMGVAGGPLQTWTNVAPHGAIGLGHWAIGRDIGWPSYAAYPEPFNNRFIDGLVDEVRFYERSLDYSDAFALFNQFAGDPTDPTPTPTPTPTELPDTDTDGDGKPDVCETTDLELLPAPDSQWTHALLPDSDGDGLLDGEEDPGDCDAMTTGPLAMTNPRNRDTDGDGIPDGVEVLLLGTDPLDPDDPADTTDTSGDGLPDYYAIELGLDPENPDSDGDGFTDAYELLMGSDPLDSDSRPTLGDVDGNGVTNNLDAVWLFNFVVGRMPAPDRLDRADISLDAQINNVDALALFHWLLGDNPTIPVY